MSGQRDRQPQRGHRKPTRPGAAAGADRAAGPPALRLAQAMLRRGEYDAALRQFEQAVRQHPTHLQVLLQAARALGRRYRTDRAGSLLEKAVRLAPRQPEVQFLVGEAYRCARKAGGGAAAYERACLLVDLFPDAQVELAFLYERCHRLPEAFELIRRVLVAQPRRTKAILLKARILRRQSQHTQAESLLQQILQLEPHNSPLPRRGVGRPGAALRRTAAIRCGVERDSRVEADPVAARRQGVDRGADRLWPLWPTGTRSDRQPVSGMDSAGHVRYVARRDVDRLSSFRHDAARTNARVSRGRDQLRRTRRVFRRDLSESVARPVARDSCCASTAGIDAGTSSGGTR